MTQEYDPAYLDNLVVVAADDVAVIREKEKTYRGSWKRRGGVGAFMMMARKWDRLESMLSYKDGTQYNIFAAIGARPRGEDGSALAEVRDLRRYLMLIEAEMMHLDVVRPEMLPPGPPVATVGLATADRGIRRSPDLASPYRDDPNCEPLEKTKAADLQYEMPYGGATGSQLLGLAVAWGSSSNEAYERLVRIAGTRYDPIRALMRKWVKDEAGVIAELKLSRREDSNPVELQDHGEIVRKTPPDPRQFDFGDRYQDGLPREEYEKTSTPYVYDVVSNTAIVNRVVAVQDAWSHLPRLLLEQNQKEWEEQPLYYRHMYYWTGEKWCLSDTFKQHWGQL